MKYIPRYEEPKRDNKNYYSDINQLYRDGFGMPNCTCYSLGRWIEILGYVPKLSVGSAWRWYEYTQDGYKRGQVPKLGAIACWVHKDRSDYGHVAVVEDFNNDYINCSNSAYQSTNFYMKKYYKSDNYNFGDFIFKGFIYLPIEFEEDKPTPKPTKSIDELAKEVIEGKWGNNPERKEKLIAAGYDYEAIQNKVNEMLAPKVDMLDLVKRTIRGDFGNGNERRRALGSNYDEVQRQVNLNFQNGTTRWDNIKLY